MGALVVAEYVIWGGGDFAIEVVTYLKDVHFATKRAGWTVSAIVTPSEPRLDDFEKLLGYRPQVVSSALGVPAFAAKLSVVGIGDPVVRHRVMDEICEAGGKLGTVVHPQAYVSESADVGEGTIICPFAFVGPFAELGKNCALNVGAIVGHDARLGASSVLSPGANINGHGCTGIAAFLGAGAIVNPKVQLGAYSKLSAGSVLKKSVGDGFLMHGNAADGRKMIRIP